MEPSRDANTEIETERSAVKAAGAFRTIREVAEDLDLPQHVLRFWETRFPQVKPLKRAGGRRYYRPEDVALLRRIRDLLHGEGYTIKGVQKLLRDEGRARPPAGGGVAVDEDQRTARARASVVLDPRKRAELESVIEELGDLRDLLRKPLA